MFLKLMNSPFSEAGCLKVRLKMKILMVFDFDHTVVDENCDIWVIKYVLKVLLHVTGSKKLGIL